MPSPEFAHGVLKAQEIFLTTSKVCLTAEKQIETRYFADEVGRVFTRNMGRNGGEGGICPVLFPLPHENT